MFKSIYKKVLVLANHKLAIYYLAILSFFESFILPYPPPDILLAPMVLKKPLKGYKFALICTLFSVFGGVVGYAIGVFAIDFIIPILEKLHYLDKLEIVKNWFDEYGILIVFVAGFSPMPYKVFTIGAGIMSMPLLPFVLISLFARGLRFFLVAFIVKKFGNKCDEFLQKYVDYFGYGIIILMVLFIGYKML